MKNTFFYLLFLTFYLASSCTEDYHLHTMEQSRIVTIEGFITDEEGPYLVKITENQSNLAGDTLTTTVLDAQVTVADDAGHTDKLKPLWKEKIASRVVSGGDYTWLRYFLLLPKYDGGCDSLGLSDYKPDASLYEGMYYTTSISGTPGRTYTLTATTGNQVYTATDRMPYGTLLDSVVMRPNGIGADGKIGDGFYVPYLYFPVPQNQENYFLFTWEDIEAAIVADYPVPRSFHELFSTTLHTFHMGD